MSCAYLGGLPGSVRTVNRAEAHKRRRRCEHQAEVRPSHSSDEAGESMWSEGDGKPVIPRWEHGHTGGEEAMETGIEEIRHHQR